MKREKMTAGDGKQITMTFWDEVSAPTGVVQLIHGMAEHIARYEDFSAYLNENGFILAGDDHRAHGYTDENALGLAGEGDLFSKTVADERQITALLRERYGLPVIVMGHSYGSFLTQSYIAGGTEGAAGFVLSGSAFMKGFMVNFGYSLAKSKSRKHRDEPGNVFAKLTFKSYDKKFHEGINGWLSRDLSQVGKYNTDSLCGFVCSNGFYESFFKGLKKTAADPHENIDKNLKLYITSGGLDAVGGYSKLVHKLYRRYEAMGLKPQYKLYPGARHEIINETNNAEVYSDLLKFFKSCI